MTSSSGIADYTSNGNLVWSTAALADTAPHYPTGLLEAGSGESDTETKDDSFFAHPVTTALTRVDAEFLLISMSLHGDTGDTVTVTDHQGNPIDRIRITSLATLTLQPMVRLAAGIACVAAEGDAELIFTAVFRPLFQSSAINPRKFNFPITVENDW